MSSRPLDRAQGVGQPEHLLASFAIAPEQDETGGIGVAEERALVGGQFSPARP